MKTVFFIHYKNRNCICYRNGNMDSPIQAFCASFMPHRFTLPSASQSAQSHTRNMDSPIQAFCASFMPHRFTLPSASQSAQSHTRNMDSLIQAFCASFMPHRFTLPSASQSAQSHTRKSAEVTVLSISNSTISQLSLCFHTHKPLTSI